MGKNYRFQPAYKQFHPTLKSEAAYLLIETAQELLKVVMQEFIIPEFRNFLRKLRNRKNYPDDLPPLSYDDSCGDDLPI